MIGPPLLFNGKLDESMKQEHTARDDSSLEFTSSNGVTTTSATEWEVVMTPEPGRDYPDRSGFVASDVRRRARNLVPIEELRPAMEQQNKRLKELKQSEMVMEELIAARLYTGPMCVPFLPPAAAPPLVHALPHQVSQVQSGAALVQRREVSQRPV